MDFVQIDMCQNIKYLANLFLIIVNANERKYLIIKYMYTTLECI